MVLMSAFWQDDEAFIQELFASSNADPNEGNLSSICIAGGRCRGINYEDEVSRAVLAFDALVVYY